MSTLHVILFFGGIPVLILTLITLAVIAPSLAKGPRYRSGQDWNASPTLIGSGTDADAAPSVEAEPVDVGVADTGGASARW